MVWIGHMRQSKVLKTAVIERKKARVEQLLAKNAYAQDEIDQTLTYYFMSVPRIRIYSCCTCCCGIMPIPMAKRMTPPLMQTIYHNDLAVARVLIEYGADPKKAGYIKSLPPKPAARASRSSSSCSWRTGPTQSERLYRKYPAPGLHHRKRGRVGESPSGSWRRPEPDRWKR